MDQIEREVVLPVPPLEVWEVVTGAGWLADEVELELVPGGEARFSSEASAKTGWIEEASSPDGGHRTGRLVFWWSIAYEPATRVELTLEPEGDGGTRLRVVETRPLEVIDVVGIPLPPGAGSSDGPAMLLAA